MWSYFEITGIIDEKGYKDVETLWYKAAGRDLNDGLKQLVDDAGALEMIRIAKCEGCVHLYVLHPEIVHHIVGNERNDLFRSGKSYGFMKSCAIARIRGQSYFR